MNEQQADLTGESRGGGGGSQKQSERRRLRVYCLSLLRRQSSKSKVQVSNHSGESAGKLVGSGLVSPRHAASWATLPARTRPAPAHNFRLTNLNLVSLFAFLLQSRNELGLEFAAADDDDDDGGDSRNFVQVRKTEEKREKK